MWRYLHKAFRLFLKLSGFQDLLDLLKNQTQDLGEKFPELAMALGRAFLFIIILIGLFILGVGIATYIALKMTGI